MLETHEVLHGMWVKTAYPSSVMLLLSVSKAMFQFSNLLLLDNASA